MPTKLLSSNIGVCTQFWPLYDIDVLQSETNPVFSLYFSLFACKVMLLLEVLIKVGEKYLMCQYVFIVGVERSQSALQTLGDYFLYNIKNVPAFLEMAWSCRGV